MPFELINLLRIATGGQDIKNLLRDDTEKNEYDEIKMFYQKLIISQNYDEDDYDKVKPNIQALLKLKRSRHVLGKLGLKFSNLAVFNFNAHPFERTIPNVKHPARAVRVPWIPEKEGSNSSKDSYNVIKEIIKYFQKIDTESPANIAITDFRLPEKILVAAIGRYIKEKEDTLSVLNCIKKCIDSDGETINCPSISLSRSICGVRKENAGECQKHLCYNLIEDILFDCWEDCAVEIGRVEGKYDLRQDSLYKIFKSGIFSINKTISNDGETLRPIIEQSENIQTKSHIIYIDKEEIKQIFDKKDTGTNRLNYCINKYIQGIREDQQMPLMPILPLSMTVSQLNPDPYFSIAVLYLKSSINLSDVETAVDIIKNLSQLFLVFSLIASFNIEVIVREDLVKKSKEAGVSKSTSNFMHDTKNKISVILDQIELMEKKAGKNDWENVRRLIDINYMECYKLLSFSHKAHIASFIHEKIFPYYKLPTYFLNIKRFLKDKQNSKLYNMIQNSINMKDNVLSLKDLMLLVSTNMKSENINLVFNKKEDCNFNILPLWGLWGAFEEIFHNAIKDGAKVMTIEILIEEVSLINNIDIKEGVIKFINNKDFTKKINIVMKNEFSGDRNDESDNGGDNINKDFIDAVGIGKANYTSVPAGNSWEINISLWPEFWESLYEDSIKK